MKLKLAREIGAPRTRSCGNGTPRNLGRLPGLKFMWTRWVCDVSGGPYQFKATKPGATPLGLEEAHRDLRISPAEFDEVAAELGQVSLRLTLRAHEEVRLKRHRN